jgi:predicted ester cyclase
MNVADCEVNDGLITYEWLVRDNLALIRQLGFDPATCAGIVAQKFDERQSAWLASEYSRTVKNDTASSSKTQYDPAYEFALDVLKNCWQSGDESRLESAYQPYCVLRRAPLQIHSGRNRILKHYADWRQAIPGASLNIDNVCSQSFDQHNQRIAVRWSVAGVHEGEFANTPGTGKPIYILGITHWQVVDGRITHEWTVFDELAVLAQTLV